MAVWNTIKITDINPDRFDAEYFRKDYKKNLEILQKTGNTTTIGRLFKKVDRGEKPNYQKAGSIPVLRSVNVRLLGFNDTRQEYVTEEFFLEKTRGQVLKNDILITSTGTGTLGRTSIWYSDKKAFNVPENSFLREPIMVDPYLIATYFNTDYGREQLFQHQRGSSGQLHLYPVDIKKIIVPECLFPYQNEIGNYLKVAFRLQGKSKSLYTQATQRLEEELGLNKIEFKKEVSYVSSFSDVIASHRLDSNHFQPKFDQLLDHIKTNFEYIHLGASVILNRRGVQPIYIPNGTKKVITSQNITTTHLDYDNFESTSDQHYTASPEAHVKCGDILTYTTGAYVGQTNICLETEPTLASNHVNIIRLKGSEIDPTYVAFVMNSLVGQLQTKKHIRGSAQAELYPSDIAKFIIPILNQETITNISQNVKDSLEARRKSNELLVKAKQEVETLIEQAAKESTI